MMYIIVIALFALVGVYVAYEVKRSKRLKRENTKINSEVYRRNDSRN